MFGNVTQVLPKLVTTISYDNLISVVVDKIKQMVLDSKAAHSPEISGWSQDKSQGAGGPNDGPRLYKEIYPIIFETRY